MEYFSRPRETWDAKKCAKASSSAPPDFGGNRPPKGIIQGDSSPYPRYGRQSFNGGILLPGGWFQGTDNPYPVVTPPWGLYRLCSWGIVITTAEDAKARELPELILDHTGRPRSDP